MKRREKNELLKKMAAALDDALMVPGLSKEQQATIVGLLREIDREIPGWAAATPRKYNKLIADGKLDLTIEVVR